MVFERSRWWRAAPCPGEEARVEVFVVRLWPGDPALRGKVEHVVSGLDEVFEGGEELLSLLSAEIARPRTRRSDVDVPAE